MRWGRYLVLLKGAGERLDSRAALTGLEIMGRWAGLEEQQRDLRDRGLKTLQAPHPWYWRSPPSLNVGSNYFLLPHLGSDGGRGKSGEGEFTLNPVL